MKVRVGKIACLSTSSSLLSPPGCYHCVEDWELDLEILEWDGSAALVRWQILLVISNISVAIQKKVAKSQGIDINITRPPATETA